MWLSCVWSERCESHKEQNKAFKLLSCSYQKKQNSSKKRKKETEQNSLNKMKQRRRRRRRRSKEEEDEEQWVTDQDGLEKSLNFSLNRLLHPIRTDTARVGANQPDSVRIGPSQASVRRGKKKKKGRGTNRRQRRCLRNGCKCGGRFATSMHPSVGL